MHDFSTHLSPQLILKLLSCSVFLPLFPSLSSLSSPVVFWSRLGRLRQLARAHVCQQEDASWHFSFQLCVDSVMLVAWDQPDKNIYTEETANSTKPGFPSPPPFCQHGTASFYLFSTPFLLLLLLFLHLLLVLPLLLLLLLLLVLSIILMLSLLLLSYFCFLFSSLTFSLLGNHHHQDNNKIKNDQCFLNTNNI